MTGVLLKRGETHGNTHRDKGHVTTDAETGVMQPQSEEAKIAGSDQKPGRGTGPEPSKDAGPAHILNLDFEAAELERK